MDEQVDSTLVQIGWVVHDLYEAMTRFGTLWCIDNWTVTEWPRKEPGNVVSWHRGDITTTWKARMASARLSSIEIELIQNLEGRSAYQEWIDLKGESPHHVMFRVVNLQSAIERYRCEGISMITAAGVLRNGLFVPQWAIMDTAALLRLNTELISDQGF